MQKTQTQRKRKANQTSFCFSLSEAEVESISYIRGYHIDAFRNFHEFLDKFLLLGI